MSVVLVSEVNFRGNGSTGSIFYNADTQKLLSQPGAVGVQPVNVEVSVMKDGVLPHQQATALIAVDGSGNPLDGPNDLLVLPCPPYCGVD